MRDLLQHHLHLRLAKKQAKSGLGLLQYIALDSKTIHHRSIATRMQTGQVTLHHSCHDSWIVDARYSLAGRMFSNTENPCFVLWRTSILFAKLWSSARLVDETHVSRTWRAEENTRASLWFCCKSWHGAKMWELENSDAVRSSGCGCNKPQTTRS